MIRVLQIYDSLAISSGISSVLVGWFDKLIESDIKIDFLCSWNKTPSYDKHLTEKGANVWYVSDKDSIGNVFCFIQKVDDFFKLHANEYDIVHLHSATFVFPYFYYAKKYGIKIRIVHAHSASLGNSKKSSARNSLLLIPMKKLATNFIACSNEAAFVWFIKRKIDIYKILLNGIDTEKYTFDECARNKYRMMYGIDDDEYIIGHISNMNPIKNVPFLLDIVFELIKLGYNIRIVFVGCNNIPEYIDKKIKLYDMKDYIINIGICNNINELINMFDVCVMPSISEGYGLVPVEVQAVGIPVIMSVGFPEVVCFSDESKRIQLNAVEWIKELRILIDGKRQPNIGNHELLKNFDISQIAGELLSYYKSLKGIHGEDEENESNNCKSI